MPKIFSLLFGSVFGKAPIIVKDEGVEITDSVSSMDFVGAGVSATATGSDVTITVNSSGDSFTQMQPMSGTTPTADTGADTLTFDSSDNLIEIVGDSTTDTLNFIAGSAFNTTVRGLLGATNNITYNPTTGVFGATNLPVGFSLNVNFPLNYNNTTRTVGITIGVTLPIVYNAVNGFFGISLIATAPLTYNGTGTLGITLATSTTNGYLSSVDWNTFNNKVNLKRLEVMGS